MPQEPIDWIADRLGLVAFDEDGRGRVVASAAARELLGGSDYPNLGMALQRLLGDELDPTALEDALSKVRRGARCEIQIANGRCVLLTQESNGHVRAMIAPVRAFAPLAAAPEDVRAGVSHELANALGAIAGWARLAKQGRRVQEALDLIEMSAESAWSAAQRVLGDRRSKAPDATESVDLSAFVDEAARLLGPKATARGVQVRTAIQPELRVRGDRGSAWSIVWNLAANAIEALSPGGTVELRLVRVDDKAMLFVEDNGPGMTAEQQRRVFEPYFTTKPTGTGLGLPLVKQAITDVGGTIELVSEPGLGTRFTVVLPLASAQARAPQPKRSSGVFYAEPIPHRILVVDDDLGLREMIATALGMRGAEIVAVERAEDALTQTGPFALAIVDLLLPGTRGDALLAKLRSAGIVNLGVLMTGTELPAPLAAGGAPDVLLRKPFELEELFAGLALALGQAESERSVG